MIELVKGDIFDADVEAVVNAVNAHGVMGAGLALQFKNRYPCMYAEYKRRCTAGEFGPGEVMPVKVDDSNPRWVINFATKDHWRDPSKLEYIERGLADLRRAIHSLELISVAIPALGCGLGQLDWPTVRARIKVFAATLPKIRVAVPSLYADRLHLRLEVGDHGLHRGRNTRLQGHGPPQSPPSF
jgi:O-acetyl-ADP-ribose deacetylase (regulator of RNase III)